MGRRAVTLGAVVLFAVGLMTVVVLHRPETRGAVTGLVPLPALTGAGSTMAASAPDAPVPSPRPVTVEGTLANLPTSAQAWQLTDHVELARVVQLAKAFGLAGVPTATPEGGWAASGPNRWLQVQRAPGSPWVVGSGPPPPRCEPPPPPCAPNGACPEVACSVGGTASASGGAPAAGSGGGSSSAPSGSSSSASGGPQTDPPITPPTTAVDGTTGSFPRCLPPPCPPGGRCPAIACGPVGPPPTTVPVDEHLRAGAVAAATSLVRRLGFEVDASHAEAYPGAGGWVVAVGASVSGVATQGWWQQVTVDATGAAISGYGYLALPTKAGAYPLAGVKAGLDRLSRGEIVWSGGDGGGVFGGAVDLAGPPVTAVAPPAPAGSVVPPLATTTSRPPPPSTTSVLPGKPAIPATTVPAPGSVPPVPAICKALATQPCPSPPMSPGPRPCIAPAASPTTTLDCPVPVPLPACNGFKPPTTPPCADVPPGIACNGSATPTTTACVPLTPPAPPPLVVTGVRLGLAFVASAGRAWLEPVYVFTTKDEGDISVPAVVDALVAKPTPAPEPAPLPLRVPITKGSAPGGAIPPSPPAPTTRPTVSGPPVPTAKPPVGGPPASVTIGPPPAP